MDNSTQHMSEKLVQYLDGELKGDVKQDIEHQLAADKKLNEEFESLKAAREAVKIFGMQQQVSEIHGQMMKELQAPVKKISSVRRIIRYSIAVAASVILIAAGIIGYNFYTLSSNKVFASNFHSYELSTFRDGDSNQVSPVEKAYRDKDFKKTVELFSQNSSLPVKETFLAAMSYVELGNNARAIEEFRKVITENEKNKSGLFRDEAEYFLALTYILNKDYDFALELLRSIRENPVHLYHNNISGKLIRQVKMLKWR